MKKKFIFKYILEEHKQDQIRWKDIKHLDLQDDDVINASYEAPYYSENNSNDGFYNVSVGRLVLETDEEFENRKKFWKELTEKSKDERYQSYLKLKKGIRKIKL